ncbi:hypothetical protein PR202_ga17613 [Eleusine coracana subsp. coracana]|uniref:Protein NLRC3 n=1 Tax=Eleusine coracana subsp. coracana TaxID=191504 RepID=A0AAV5CQ62_ELECO|nr:hypothetical protein PR202_ga17366 [Eleusine coracana subsp. coracana]GJN00431.1 hypothetical protein PR202_ga17613 [Eleusine coracana subsp. coracana]
MIQNLTFLPSKSLPLQNPRASSSLPISATTSQPPRPAAMESSLLLSSTARPIKPFRPLPLPLPFPFARRRHASLGARPPSTPPPRLVRRRPSVAPRAAAHDAFDDGFRSGNRPPGVGRGGAGRRAYREAQGEAAVPPAAAAARAVAPYVVPAGAVLVLSFVATNSLFQRTVLWKVVQNLFPGKTKDRNSGESEPSGIMWSFAAGSNLAKSTASAEKESRKNLNKFYKELRTLKTVNMAGRQFGDEGLFFLAESLAYNKSAEEVDFSGNGITAVGIEAFDGVLQINTTLKALNLSGNSIGDEGAKCLSDILVENVGIQKLLLNSTNIGDEGAKAISNMLKKNKTIRILQLSNNTIEYSGFASIAEALLENNAIRSLYLKLVTHNPVSFHEIHLHGNGIGNEGVRELMSALSAHKGKITVVDIGNNNIGSEGLRPVAEFIKRTKSLLWFSLYMNDISDEGGNNIHSKGVCAIAETLKENAVLSTLDLSYNPIGPDGVKALCDVLKFHGKIQTLKLGWCQIGVPGAEFIADCLKYNTTLSTLDLRANGLGDDDDGAFALAQALKANEDLAVTSLNLSNNFFTKFGQVALTEARDHVYEMCEKEIDIYF